MHSSAMKSDCLKEPTTQRYEGVKILRFTTELGGDDVVNDPFLLIQSHESSGQTGKLNP